MANLTYPDGKNLHHSYDAFGRLTWQTDWNGKIYDYAYDSAGRLAWRTYPNDTAQHTTFDVAGRLESLAYKGMGIDMAWRYAHDKNGNTTHATETGTLSWTASSAMDEISRFTPANRLIDKKDVSALGAEGWTYHYSDSGNMTNAVVALTGGVVWQTYALEYDEDNRILSIDWNCGLTKKTITNRYDALGRRISRTVDDKETRFVLDIRAMERVLCETDKNNNITAYYIHAHDLVSKIGSDSSALYYHPMAPATLWH